MKTQIRLKALDKTTLSIYLIFIKKLLKKFKITKASVYRLPTKRKRISLLKSPHVYKKAFEQFELRIHNVLIDIKANNNNLIKYFLINKPKSIVLKIKHFN